MTQRIVPPMDDPPTWHNPGVRVLDSDTSEPRSVKAVKLVVYAAEHDGAFVVPKLRNVVITLCCDAEGECNVGCTLDWCIFCLACVM